MNDDMEIDRPKINLITIKISTAGDPDQELQILHSYILNIFSSKLLREDVGKAGIISIKDLYARIEWKVERGIDHQ